MTHWLISTQVMEGLDQMKWAPNMQQLINPNALIAKLERRYESDVSGDATTDPAKLPAAYRRTFEVASELGLAAVALPAVSCGVFGYPLADAARIGTRAAVASNIDHVEFVLFSDELYEIFATAAEDACGPPLT